MIYFLAGVLMTIQVQAQQQTGRVVYEYTRQMMVRMARPRREPNRRHRRHLTPMLLNWKYCLVTARCCAGCWKKIP